MLTALRLVSVLNAMDAGLLSAPEAEATLTAGGEIHQVVDPDGLLGTASDLAGSLRLALGRVGHSRLGGGWALVVPRPGRAAGLRGPRELTRSLTAAGQAVVVHHLGGVLWQPIEVDADGSLAVQWRLHRAERPSLALMPGEAARVLGSELSEAAAILEQLGLVAGRPVQAAVTVTLGAGYPRANQLLLDRALRVQQVIEPALDASVDLLHSHGVLTREQALRRVETTALDAVQAAASWPSHLMN